MIVAITGSAIELASRPHATAGASAQELEALRERLEDDLAPLGLRAGVAGTHPFAQWTDVRVSGGPRYQSIYDSMREASAQPSGSSSITSSSMPTVHGASSPAELHRAQPGRAVTRSPTCPSPRRSATS